MFYASYPNLVLHLLLQSPRFIPIFCSYCAIYLWCHSRITLPVWLLYYHISYCSYNWVWVCIAPTSSPPTIPSMPSYTITMSYPSFDVIDPHYEGLVDVVHWLGFLVRASPPPYAAAYEKPSQWTTNWIPHVYCCRVVWYDASSGRRIGPLELIRRPLDSRRRLLGIWSVYPPNIVAMDGVSIA